MILYSHALFVIDLQVNSTHTKVKFDKTSYFVKWVLLKSVTSSSESKPKKVQTLFFFFFFLPK